MFNIGFGEFAIIFIVLIIAVGPERLPTMMRTVGKTMRTLRQASRDLRQSTGIDELMRDDFIDIYSPPRRPAPPPGPAIEARTSGDEPLLASNNPMATAALAASAPAQGVHGAHDGDSVTAYTDPANFASLPSDGPVTDHVASPAAMPVPAHDAVEPSLPSDAPVAAFEGEPSRQHDDAASDAVPPSTVPRSRET
jgi:sec-independent protein translocase protein TatB